MTPNQPRPRVRAVVCWCAVLVTSVFTAVGIAVLAPRMAPMRPGSSHMFWKLACGVTLSPEVADVWGGDAYFVGDAWAAGPTTALIAGILLGALIFGINSCYRSWVERRF